MKNPNDKHINLEKLAGGAFAEKLHEALIEVAANIQNPNTSATAQRGITINIKFSPDKRRQMANTTITVSTKLAATEAIDTQMIMGLNMKTGKIEVAEYDAMQGQMSLFDSEQPDEPQTADETPEQTTGKPLDLKNRTKKQEPNTGDLVPGRDYDPNTGEVFENTEQTTAKVISFNPQAAQA